VVSVGGLHLASSGASVIAIGMIDAVKRNPGESEQLPQPVVGNLHRSRRRSEPGAGCGKAVDIAVWNVTCPSTLCMT
jgi:hypothetical protein